MISAGATLVESDQWDGALSLHSDSASSEGESASISHLRWDFTVAVDLTCRRA
jgi:hypothetical protein